MGVWENCTAATEGQVAPAVQPAQIDQADLEALIFGTIPQSATREPALTNRALAPTLTRDGSRRERNRS